MADPLPPVAIDAVRSFVHTDRSSDLSAFTAEKNNTKTPTLSVNDPYAAAKTEMLPDVLHIQGK